MDVSEEGNIRYLVPPGRDGVNRNEFARFKLEVMGRVKESVNLIPRVHISHQNHKQVYVRIRIRLPPRVRTVQIQARQALAVERFQLPFYTLNEREYRGVWIHVPQAKALRCYLRLNLCNQVA